MYKKLEEIIKNIKGNVFAICLDDKLMNVFDKNNKITIYSLVSNDNKKKIEERRWLRLFFGFRKGKPKYKKNKKGKDINIKKIRKEIDKKSVDYLFCNMNEIFLYYKYFIKDSIYMTRGKIYLYFDNDIDKEFLIDKYKRYKVKIKDFKYKDGYILEVDAKESKNKFFMEKVYFIKDSLYNIAEFIGNLMIS